jgi:hypothetical protein
MSHEVMYFVIRDKAIAIDQVGNPIICNLVTEENGDEFVDWDSADVIDWLDLSPTAYSLYKDAVEFLQQHTNQSLYIK